jgi:hypothetical protein
VTQRGYPTAAEVLAAVSEFLRSEVVPCTDKRVGFHARVAANLVDAVERELLFGAEADATHRARLDTLGVVDDTELAAQLRDGQWDARLTDLIPPLRATTIERLRIASPSYFAAGDA